MGTRALHLLHRYWEKLKMVLRTGGYYREPFHGERGLTQGDPLLPTIFNVVVDTVVRHWESLVVKKARWGNSDDDEARQPEEGRTIQERDNGKRRVEEGHVRLKVK